ncbi:MAG: hypothetical protein GY705_24025, partial [Bacteroidetes bacterium]|nr:hypothetical protein [Bacteroidota bacterium]
GGSKTVTATFNLIPVTHEVTTTVTGSGSVLLPGGSNCNEGNSPCVDDRVEHSTEDYVATRPTGHSVNFTNFDSTSGDTGTLTDLLADRSISVAFALYTNTLIVTKNPAGTSTGELTGTKIDTGTGDNEHEDGAYGEQVAITASYGSDTEVTYTGCTTVVDDTCYKTLNVDSQDGVNNVSARFDKKNTYTLTGVENRSTLEYESGGQYSNTTFYEGDVVRLIQECNTGNGNPQWSGCTREDNGVCEVEMTSNQTVIATCDPNVYTLQVQYNPMAKVTVQGAIDCGLGANDCTETLAYGTNVTAEITEVQSGYEATGIDSSRVGVVEGKQYTFQIHADEVLAPIIGKKSSILSFMSAIVNSHQTIH